MMSSPRDSVQCRRLFSADREREILRAAIGPHTARWAEGKGLLMQLNSLEQAWPHLFALSAAALEGKERPWVARDESDSALEKAYKRAALLLHPDRLVSKNRDLSVRVNPSPSSDPHPHPTTDPNPDPGPHPGPHPDPNPGPNQVEGEEVLKQLQAAYEDRPSWLLGSCLQLAQRIAAATGGASQPRPHSSSCSSADEPFGGASTSGGGGGGGGGGSLQAAVPINFNFPTLSRVDAQSSRYAARDAAVAELRRRRRRRRRRWRRFLAATRRRRRACHFFPAGSAAEPCDARRGDISGRRV